MSSVTIIKALDANSMIGRELSRTPPPTPSEQDAMSKSAFKLFMWNFRSNVKRPWYTYLIWVIIFALVILLTVFQNDIIKWLHPAVSKMRSLRGGFIIPVVLLFILSFPPLFGQEFIAVVIGVVWGVGIGFILVAVGTVLGEIGNFYAYRRFLRKYAARLEERQVKYAMLGRIIREGGLLTAVMARYSVIPTHFVTAMFAVCGMNFWIFLVSAILSLPLYLSLVFLGHYTEDQDEHRATTLEGVANYLILVASIVLTILAMWYLTRQMDLVKMDVIARRRKARKVHPFSVGYTDSSRTEFGNFSNAEIGVVYERPTDENEYSPVSHKNTPSEYTLNGPPDVDSLSAYERACAAPSFSVPKPMRHPDTLSSFSTLRGFEKTVPEVYKLQSMTR